MNNLNNNTRKKKNIHFGFVFFDEHLHTIINNREKDFLANFFNFGSHVFLVSVILFFISSSFFYLCFTFGLFQKKLQQQQDITMCFIVENRFENKK